MTRQTRWGQLAVQITALTRAGILYSIGIDDSGQPLTRKVLADGTWTPSVSKRGGSSSKQRVRIEGENQRGEVVVRRQETSRWVWGLLYSIVGGLARDHESIFGRQCGRRDRDFVWWAVGLLFCTKGSAVTMVRQ